MEQYASWSLDASEITVPALIIHGNKDINVPFSQSQALARAMPDARFYPIEGGDHFMPASHADELRAQIEPRSFHFPAIELHIYRGGPWDAVKRCAFRGQ